MTTATATATTATAAAVITYRTVPKGGGYGVPLAPAIYRPHQTKDGRWVWRLEERELLGWLYSHGSRRERGVYSEAKAQRIAEELGAARGIEVYGRAAHNRPLTDAEIARFVKAA